MGNSHSPLPNQPTMLRMVPVGARLRLNNLKKHDHFEVNNA
ncbi:MAG: hypothetical protein ABSG67_00750 [Thermoguttaceae bacterium]|jgi:hypothetical protein